MKPILSQAEWDNLMNPPEETEGEVTFSMVDDHFNGELSANSHPLVEEAVDEPIGSYNADEGLYIWNKKGELIAFVDCDYKSYKKFDSYMKSL